MKANNVRESILVKKLERQKIKRNAVKGAAKPIDLEGIRDLQTDGLLTFEAFVDNIGSIFPFILNQVSEGVGIREIERIMGMKARVLEQFLQRHKLLGNKVRKARAVKLDSNHDLIDIFS